MAAATSVTSSGENPRGDLYAEHLVVLVALDETDVVEPGGDHQQSEGMVT